MDKAALKKWAIVLGLGIIIWFCPVPAGLSPAVWKLFAIFVATIAKVLTWKDIISEKGAWDAMFWMGGLMALATALSKSGFMMWAAAFIQDLKRSVHRSMQKGHFSQKMGH